jgi:hypothetical protein
MKRLLSIALLSFVVGHVMAATEELTLTIQNHAFAPKEIPLEKRSSCGW